MRKLPILIGALVPLAMLAIIALMVASSRGHHTARLVPVARIHPVAAERAKADEFYAKRDLKAAKAAYEAIIRKHAGSKDKLAQDQVAAARMRLGYVLAKTEGYAKAREVFLAAAKSYKGTGAMDPEFGRLDDQAAFQAAVCLVGEGKKDEARREFRRIVKDRTKSPVIYLAFRRMQRLGDPNKEEQALMQASIAKQESWMKFEMSVCGPKSIAYLLDRLGRPAKNYEQIAKLCHTGEQGTTMQGMRDAMKELGLDAVGLMVNRKDFAALAVPAIWLNQDHYVVLLGVKGNDAEVYDPCYATRRTAKLPDLDDPSFMATVLVIRSPRPVSPLHAERGEGLGVRGR